MTGMLLEALINRTTGEVIVVAPAGKAWGAFERSYFKVVEWQDAGMDGIEDVVPNPYTTYGEDGPVRSKWMDVSGIDLSGGVTLAWGIVEPRVRSA